MNERGVQMIGQLGPFLRSLQEEVIIRRPKPQGLDGYDYPCGEDPILAIILDNRSSPTLSNLVEQGYSYACNLTPPRDEIRAADQIVRTKVVCSGTANEETVEQTLVVKNVETVLKIQRLWADDLNRVE